MPSMEPTAPSLWQRLAGVRPEEAPAILWSMLYVIALFLAYYVLRPIRDELGVAGGGGAANTVSHHALDAQLQIGACVFCHKHPQRRQM